MNWIDSHVHIWTPDTKAYPRGEPSEGIKPASFTAEELLSVMRPCGVSRVVLVQMSFYLQDHRYMLDAMERYPGVFAGVGLVNPERPDPAGEMRKLVIRGVRGFRITRGAVKGDWLGTPGMQAMWRYAAERRVAMCPLIDPDALPAVAKLAAEYRDATVVLDHFARVGTSGPPDEASVAALCALAKYPNVYVKASAYYALGLKKAPYADLVPFFRRVLEAYGAGHVMWGTDAPFQTVAPHSYAAAAAFARDYLGFLSPADHEWVVRKTAEAVFFPPAC